MSEQQTDSRPKVFVPPYISFAQLLNVLERMRNEGVPGRIDRSYLGSWSGSAQAQFLKATESLGLKDEVGRPTDLLKQLVADPDGRPALVADLLRAKYPNVIALGDDATQSQLDETFREFDGISGSTTRKAITFYLHAAQFAGIKTSPFFKVGRAPSGGGGSRTASRAARTPRARTSAQEQSSSSGLANAGLPGAVHPAVQTLVQALPAFSPDGTKPAFPTADREAWFAYAKATFNLIYALPDGDTGGSA